MVGTEPFWRIDVGGSRLHYTTMDNRVGGVWMATPEKTADDDWRWRSEPAGAFDLIIQRRDCSDGMSDRKYAYAALFVLGATMYPGCADVPEKFSGEGQQP